jgi:ABC-type uncharacterized transport system auxiliary subunit
MVIKSVIAGFFALILLVGCSLPGARPQAISHYVLEVPEVKPTSATATTATATTAHANQPVLLLREAESSGFTQTTRLIFSRTPGTRALYQYAHWVEPPSKRLHTLIRERLLASGLYSGVAPLGAGIQGDYQLNFRLLDFFHNAAQTPGLAQIKLEAELVQRGSARLISQRVFVAELPIARQDAAAAVAGLGQASGQVLDAMVEWLAKVQPDAVDLTQAR